MLNRFTLLTAACVAASTGLFLANGLAADDMTVTRTTVVTNVNDSGALALPSGITVKDLNADKAIEKSFKAITDDGMSKSGFDNLVAKLVDQDRLRIKDSVPNKGSLTNLDGDKNKRLTDVIADLEGAWKSKYNQKFDMDYTKVFTSDFIHIATGEVSDSQLLVGMWPLDARTGGRVTQADIDKTKDKTFGADVNLEKGRNVAIAHLMGVHGMGGLTASLIHEAGGWKFDVPNDLTAQQLYDNLVSNLSFVNTHRDAWPVDANEAYRHVTYAVTAALYGNDLSRNSGTAMDNGSVRPTDNTANNR